MRTDSPAEIKNIAQKSPAAKKRISPGDVLLSINGHAIADVLDYRFYMAERRLRLRLRRPDGRKYSLRLRKEEYEDLGLEFGDGLMDSQRRCQNSCVFCFVDQLPPGLRESLYFKDDDARLSFLFGNYITLTNLTEREAERIIQMRLSPINVSVHTMDPGLRVRMMRNPRAGESLKLLKRFALAGLDLNVQLVLCPGWNDGAQLRRSLEELVKLPSVRSIAAVPVGLTKHRERLTPLRPFTAEEARRVIDIVEEFRCEEIELCPSDEFFLLAGRDIPDTAYYGELRQLENGVGLWALLRSDTQALMKELDANPPPRAVTIATSAAAYPLLCGLAGLWRARWPQITVRVRQIDNHFFGGAITVAGLLTGQDIVAQLKDLPLGDELLIPAVCLRHERDLTLDGWTVGQIAEALGLPVRAIENDAEALVRAVIQ
ncbi:MAG: DUF512 domain-containing protein [Oscillospiraceae bacterium]|nr:DUF512 domain-containing protein [Oscillospiraceae bacterium]